MPLSRLTAARFGTLSRKRERGKKGKPMRLLVALLLPLLSTPALAQPADLVLRGGNIITVDHDWHVAQAVAVRGRRFVAIGDDAIVLRYVGPKTQVVGLAGQTVVPGPFASPFHPLFAALDGPAAPLRR